VASDLTQSHLELADPSPERIYIVQDDGGVLRVNTNMFNPSASCATHFLPRACVL
jgi:hypothetical protein